MFNFKAIDCEQGLTFLLIPYTISTDVETTTPTKGLSHTGSENVDFYCRAWASVLFNNLD